METQMSIGDAIKLMQDSSKRAGDEDNTLNQTVYHSCQALNFAVSAILLQLFSIENELKEIKQRLGT